MELRSCSALAFCCAGESVFEVAVNRTENEPAGMSAFGGLGKSARGYANSQRCFDSPQNILQYWEKSFYLHKE